MLASRITSPVPIFAASGRPRYSRRFLPSGRFDAAPGVRGVVPPGDNCLSFDLIPAGVRPARAGKARLSCGLTLWTGLRKRRDDPGHDQRPGSEAFKVLSGLAGKVAVVTGAAGGLGAASALRLSREGCRVVVVDLDGAGARKVADSLPGMSIAVTADVSVEGDV